MNSTAIPLQLLNDRAGVYRTRAPRWHACRRIAPELHHYSGLHCNRGRTDYKKGCNIWASLGNPIVRCRSPILPILIHHAILVHISIAWIPQQAPITNHNPQSPHNPCAISKSHCNRRTGTAGEYRTSRGSWPVSFSHRAMVSGLHLDREFRVIHNQYLAPH